MHVRNMFLRTNIRTTLYYVRTKLMNIQLNIQFYCGSSESREENC